MTGGPLQTLRRRIGALTRDSRDTLFLLAVLAWTLLPQLARVPAWCSAFTLGALAWRAQLAWRGRPLPDRRWLVAGLALAVAGTLWSHHTLVGKQAGLTLLLALTALKTLELHARRDAVVVFFLGFFAVLANFLYSQSLVLALAMAVSVAGLLTALALAHMPTGQPPLRQALGLTLRHAAVGTPLVVLLFLFFPRLPPLWGTPNEAAGRTGLSDEMALGQVAELATDDAIALRVRFEGPVPPQQRLYFRGPVLRLYDGRRWRADSGGIGATPRSDAPLPPPFQVVLDQPVRYEMTVEPLRIATLPLLEFAAAPPQAPPGLPLALRDDLVWQAHRPLNERWQLRASAFLDLRYLPGGTPVRPWDTLLPADAHPRTRAWAEALRRRVAATPSTPQPWIDAVLAHIRSAGYTYTLAPGPATGDPVDDFWLDRREGFCEHFAGAFAVVMRALGVPARIVTGYQGGEVNPLDGLLEVRQSDAHAWVEVWLPDRGWTRVDPTAAVSPERVQRTLRLRAPAGFVGGALAQFDPTLFTRLRQAWSALDHRWNQWVLHYSRQQQFDLLARLGWSSPDLLALARLSLWSVGVLGLLGALWAAHDARRSAAAVDPWVRALAAVRRQLARRGLDTPAHWPPRQLAGAVQARWPGPGAALCGLLIDLEQQRYAPPRSPAASPREWRRRAARACRSLPA
jgi:transglutaminase-like putative cysteine protease